MLKRPPGCRAAPPAAYRVERGLVREVWLVPLDLVWFDRIWTSADSGR